MLPRFLLTLLVLVFVAHPSPRLPVQAADPASGPIRFRNIAAESGLDFVLQNFSSKTKHMAEPMTGGVATLDYNGDGLLDVFFVNGAVLPALKKQDPKYYNRLYQAEQSRTGLKFRDVTLKAGLQGEGYSMGVAAADYDNDGFVDLFVAGVFRNLLYRNRGDGTFEDVTSRAGIKSDLWAVTGGWFDYDRDGLLDLFVVNYVEYDPNNERFCGDRNRNLRAYCHPKYFKPIPNQLYRNKGDGTFDDVSKATGISAHAGRGMGLGFGDYDRDGFLDVMVTNDNYPNFLFHNDGGKSFTEAGLLSGTALRDFGKPVAAMCADFRDYDNDGLADIFVTALAGETFPLFRNTGRGYFDDATSPSNVARLSIRLSAWGNGFCDFNNDGWKDIFTANSHVNDRIESFEASEYRLPNSVFLNQKNGTFTDVSPGAGSDFQVPRVHRGNAFGDFNKDGRIDLVVTSIEEPTELWANQSPGSSNWIILKLKGTKSNRDGIGTQVRIGNQHNMMTTALGYASSSHVGVHFGLGSMREIPEIELFWPSGVHQVLKKVAANQVLQVEEPR